MVLKSISKFFGSLLIFISIFAFIFSFMIIELANNVDVLKDSMESEEILEEMLTIGSELTLDEMKEICQQNPQEEGCDIIMDPSLLFEDGFKAISEINNSDVSFWRFLSIILLLIGIALWYAGTSDIYSTFYKVSLTMLFSILPYFIILFFSSSLSSSNFINDIINKINKVEVSPKLTELTLNAVKVWYDAAIQDLKPLLITLFAVSLALTILFYFLKGKSKKSHKTSRKP